MVFLRMERDNAVKFSWGRASSISTATHRYFCLPIFAFRRNNLALINESFLRVLEMAAQLQVLKVGQITVAIDGTKVLASASKPSWPRLARRSSPCPGRAC